MTTASGAHPAVDSNLASASGARGTVLQTPRVGIGRFRRHPSEPDFSDTGPTRATLLVFPRLPVGIAQSGHRSVVADSSVVMLYNAQQEYRRYAISPEGDLCDWFSFSPRDVCDALGETAGSPDTPFSQAFVRAPASLVLRARALFNAASLRADPLALEEAALALLGAAVSPRDKSAPTRASLELLDAAQHLLSLRFTQRLTLGQLAGMLETSPFTLCRAFAASGTTVRRHLTHLRVCAALDLIPQWRGELTALSLELGFCHHAHFTAAFRRAFGVTPRAWATQLRSARI